MKIQSLLMLAALVVYPCASFAQAPGLSQAQPLLTRVPQDHPLKPAMDVAYEAWQECQNIHDYSCILIKREEVGGKLTPHEFVQMKIRHKPFSIYIYCLGPTKPKGQEAIFVEGRNNNMVLGHTTGIRDRLVGTVALSPTDPRMMEGTRYPITNAGVQNLVKKLMELFEYESQFGECNVQILHGAQVDGRTCRCVEVVHPVPRTNFKFHIMRAYFDEQTKLPIRWEAYRWPAVAGGPPILVEEVTYRDIRLNQGFTDLDFDPRNPAYAFR